MEIWKRNVPSQWVTSPLQLEPGPEQSADSDPPDVATSGDAGAAGGSTGGETGGAAGGVEAGGGADGAGGGTYADVSANSPGPGEEAAGDGADGAGAGSSGVGVGAGGLGAGTEVSGAGGLSIATRDSAAVTAAGVGLAGVSSSTYMVVVMSTVVHTVSVVMSVTYSRAWIARRAGAANATEESRAAARIRDRARRPVADFILYTEGGTISIGQPTIRRYGGGLLETSSTDLEVEMKRFLDKECSVLTGAEPVK